LGFEDEVEQSQQAFWFCVLQGRIELFVEAKDYGCSEKILILNVNCAFSKLLEVSNTGFVISKKRLRV
jgi:hypothetical protein